MVANFSQEAGDATVVWCTTTTPNAKFQHTWVLDNSQKNIKKMAWEWHLTSLLTREPYQLTVLHRSISNTTHLTGDSENSNMLHYDIPIFSFTSDICERVFGFYM